MALAMALSRRCCIQCNATVDKRQTLRQTVRPPQQRRRLNREQRNRLHQFSQHWLPRLLETQEEVNDVSCRISTFGERLAAGYGKAQTKLSEVMESVLAPFQADQQVQEALIESRAALVKALHDPASLRKLAVSDGLPDELCGIVFQIQATNRQLRELQHNYDAVDSSLLVLQEGAELRDQETVAYRDALLQLVEDIEQQEQEEAARLAEQARIEAELARLAEEARKAEEARREELLRRELEELVAAASAMQATAASLAVAETSSMALRGAPPIKVEVGVQLQTRPGQDVLLVGSHPSLGSWSLDGAVPMAWTDGHIWKASVDLPADSLDLEYKAVLRSNDGKVVWEKGVNHKAELQGSSDVSLYHVFQH